MENYPNPTVAASAVSSEDRTWAVLAHLSAIIAAIVSAGTLSLLGPLLVWAIKKDQSPMVREAAAGAFNFNLMFWVLYLIAWFCVFTVVLIPVAFVMFPVLFLVSLWCHVKGAMRSSSGKTYRYPFQLRVLH